MKKIVVVFLSIFLCSIFLSCGGNKNSLKNKLKTMEASTKNPVSIDEIENAIKQYENVAKEVVDTYAQVGMWHKVLGIKYLDQKMYGKALECFEKALEVFPDNANLYYYIGNCAGYLGNSALDFEATDSNQKMRSYYELSESSYLRALAIDSNYVYALYGISVLYVYQLNQPELAISYLEKLLNIDTKNIDAMFVLANAYYLTKNYDKSVSMFDKIISVTKTEETKQQAQENKKIVLDEAYSN